MKTKDNRPIGIFDSGVGGLTVLKRIRQMLPSEDIVYFGDTARVPYGNKSRSTIRRFSREIIGFLISKNVKMVVVACNTASSLALPVLKKYSMPVIGVIEPGVEEAVRVSRKKRVGVIGTTSTIKSGAYLRELKKYGRGYKLFSQSCPLFVPLVENKFIDDKVTHLVAERYLVDLRKKQVDALILGCTHYPLLKNVIGRIMKGVALIDSPSAVAKVTEKVLTDNNMRSGKSGKKASVKYYVSDDPEGFERVANIFLGEKIHVQKVTL